MLPVYTVEKSGFKNLLKTLDARYQLPGWKYFSQTAIPDLYNNVYDTVSSEIKDMEFYAGTTDLWSSKNMEPYMSFTVHFIDSNWTLKSKCLQTVYFPQDHTGENIAEGLKETLECWDLKEEKLACLTTDNISNIVEAVELNTWQRMQCFGHRLHLAINCGLKDNKIDRAKNVCKKVHVVASFSTSFKKKRDLAKVQEELQLPKHGLIAECETRWGSMQKMIARLLEQETAIQRVLSGNRKTVHLIPKWQDVEVLEAVNKAIEPLAELTDALSGEEYVSISSLLPVFQKLNSDTLADQPDDVNLTKDIKRRILNYMNEKYQDLSTQNLLNKATFLDPRYKFDFISDDNTKELIKTNLFDDVRDLTQQEITVVPSQAAEASPAAKKLKLAKFLKKPDKQPKPQECMNETAEQLFDKEISKYLAMPNLNYEADPLLWWRENGLHLPILCRLARKYLCIPATSSPSERLFNTSGQVVNCKRTCLKPHKVNMLVNSKEFRVKYMPN
ncbi:hypothetical protein SNE40_009530 [Patella caerulea]|uniref:HAT C-terminal dimerisation domain-containing protein n=1 Tax=Patella caerulea TaxID=87958 RepID=A0AAN8JTP1_PATCE